MSDKAFQIIKIKDNKGKIKECDVLFLFTPKDSDKRYVVYTDHLKNDAGLLNVYAGIYEDNAGEKVLKPIVNDEEWFTVESILAKLLEKNKEG